MRGVFDWGDDPINLEHEAFLAKQRKRKPSPLARKSVKSKSYKVKFRFY